MKILQILPLVVALTAARADLTITQQIEQPATPKPTLVTMKIKDGKVRNDINPDMSAIIDIKTGDTLTLMHKQKMAMKIPGDAVKAMQEKATGSDISNGELAIPDFKPSGRKETISGFECEEFTAKFNGQNVEVWIAKDVPDSDSIVEQLAALGGKEGSAFFSKSNIKGLPVRSAIEIPGQGKMTMTIVSINRDPLPAADFKIPNGYQEMALPAIPGQ